MGPTTPPLVLCFGEALVDRLLPPGETMPAADARGWDDRLGGAPANGACALARLGTPAAFLGRLGTDAIGEAFAALFTARGVDSRALQWDPERPSRLVLVRRDAAGERSFGGFKGDRGAGFADQAVDAGALRQAAIPLLSGARWLLCGTLPLASPRAAEALGALLAQAVSAGRPLLAVDVNWRPTFWGLPAGSAPPPAVQARIRPLLERAALLKCASEEARWFFASTDPAAISAALPGRPAVCVTDGAGPLGWYLGGCSGRLEPFAVEAVDTTGAGDAFMAGLLDGLCRAEASPHRLEAPEALVRFAAACGSLVCLGAGAIDPQPTAAEVERFLADRGGAAPMQG
jgi:fructokinase